MNRTSRIHRGWVVALLLGALLAFPPQWYPLSWRTGLARVFGVPGDHGMPHSAATTLGPGEGFCPDDTGAYRASRVVEGVEIEAAATCVADNPWLVAASVRGTNNVSPETLMASGLAADAVVMGRDLDGDGDPDEVHIRLEVAELNGSSPELAGPVTRYAIAPGIEPAFWVFVPKHFGMSTENLESQQAQPLLRMPSPALRVEQGDHVLLTLENTHYMPHTVHLHGSDHGFLAADGEGNDGVPFASEMPVMPGAARTYELTPRNAGTKFYHCHVHPHVHAKMGLQGLFIIEENRPDNWVQTLNPGAGQVRVRSRAVREAYDAEFDLHYSDIDQELNRRVQQFNDLRLLTKAMHRDYDASNSVSDYFMLNGRSFPFTYRESLVTVRENQSIKLRVVNGGRDGIALHTHGHRMMVTHRDGTEVPAESAETRDVLWLAPAQRLDLQLRTHDDGQDAFGPGIWLFHDHSGRMTTSAGIGPGGHISAIVYEQFMNEGGWPMNRGVDWTPFFTPAYYRREWPVWEQYAPGLFADVSADRWLVLRLLLCGLLGGLGLALLLRRR